MKVTVCLGSACHLKGSHQVVDRLQNLIADNKLKSQIDLGGTFCMKKCDNTGVNVTVDGKEFSLKPDEVEEFFKKNILEKLKK